MKINLTNLTRVLFFTAASTTILASGAIAQTAPTNSKPTHVQTQTLPDTIDRAFFNESGTYFENRSLVRQAAYIFGPGPLSETSFPDTEIERDAKTINIIYRDAFYQQVSSDPIIRTPDLPNPYSSSLRTMPPPAYNSRIFGSELVYEKLPPR